MIECVAILEYYWSLTARPRRQARQEPGSTALCRTIESAVQIRQYSHDPFRRPSIPLLRHLATGHISFQNPERAVQDVIPTVSYNEVRANLTGNRALGIMAQRNAWNPKNCRFFLQASAIGDNHHGVHVQVKKFKVSERVGHPQTSRLLRA